MKLHSQFLKLHSQHGGISEVAVTLDELALTLGCTHRNALHVITKMADQGWIRWIPSRGRGRRSCLVFLTDAEEIALQSMKMAISSKDMSSALEGIRGHARSSSLQDTLQGWLLAYFGHHEEIRSDKVIDTLRLPVTQQLHTFDPLHMNLLAESFVSSHIFDGLISRSSEGDKLLPGLAHAWDTDESRSIWTFYLRKEVLFHHGKVLSAEDVVYSFERMMKTSLRTLYSSIFKGIQDVKALNASTVRFVLKQPNELFLPFLCTNRAAIVPRDLEAMGESGFGRRPAGTGPFKVVEMNDDCCVLEVFPYYFQGRAHLDRVEILYVPWGITLPPSGTGSPFHVIPNPSAEDSAALSRIHSESSVRKFVTCNTKRKGPLSDPLLRADILSCIDETVETFRLKTADSPVSLQIATIPQYAGDARFVAEKLGRNGYDCTVLQISPEEFKGPVRLQSDLIVFSLLRDQDEQLRLFDLYLTLAQHVEPRMRADIEGRLKLISRDPDPAARAEGFKTIGDNLTRDHQLLILYEKPIETAYLPSVRGVTFNSQGWVDLRHLWFPPSL